MRLVMVRHVQNHRLGWIPLWSIDLPRMCILRSLVCIMCSGDTVVKPYIMGQEMRKGDKPQGLADMLPSWVGWALGSCASWVGWALMHDGSCASPHRPCMSHGRWVQHHMGDGSCMSHGRAVTGGSAVTCTSPVSGYAVGWICMRDFPHIFTS